MNPRGPLKPPMDTDGHGSEADTKNSETRRRLKGLLWKVRATMTPDHACSTGIGEPVSSSSPREERVGRGSRRGVFRKTNLLSPALLHSVEERVWLRLRRAGSIRVHLWFRFSP